MESKEAADRLNSFYNFEEHYNSRPNDFFLIYQGRQWTYRGAMQEVLRLSNYFLTLGIKKGELVALNFTNKPNFIFAILGLWAIGAIPALINYNLADTSLLHCIKVCKAKVMFYDDEVERNVATIAKELTSLGIRAIRCEDPHSPNHDKTQNEILTSRELSQQNTTRPPDVLRSGVQAVDTAALIYTSGSTGLPKAAVVPWTKFSNSPVLVSTLGGITSKDRFYTCMPVYHGTACILGLGVCLASGATLVLGHKFSNKTFWSEVKESRATVIQYVGEVCRYLMAVSPSPTTDKAHHVRMAFGNGMRPDVWENFRNRFGVQTILEFYASTEGVGGSFHYNANPLGAGAVGKAGTLNALLSRSTSPIIKIDLDTEQELRTKEGLCIPCQAGEIGEMLYQVDTTLPTRNFVGYYGNEKATNSKIIRNVRAQGDVYMRMGDLMMLKDGFLYFQDRLGDTFRWRGENVSTTEVSEAIGAFPGILEVNVYGVQVPNHDGRAGCAAILLDPSTTLDLDAFAKHVTKRLPKYAVPQFLRFVQQMEVTGNHKHQKVALRNHGVDHSKVNGDELLWFQNGTYVKFGETEWRKFVAGSARL